MRAAICVGVVLLALAPGAQAATTLTVDHACYDIQPAGDQIGLRTTITFRFSGFTGGGTLYAHYLLGSHLLLTRRLGRLSGPCGTLRTRGRLLPLRQLKQGGYTIQWDASRRYSAATSQKLGETVDVFTTVQFGG